MTGTIVFVFAAGGVTGAFINRAMTHSTPSATGGRTATGSTSSTTTVPGSTTTSPATSTTTTPVAPVLSVASVTPTDGATAVAANAPITVSMSAPLSKVSPLPVLAPTTPGSWVTSGSSFSFTPTTDFLPLSKVTVTLPGGPSGVLGADGGYLRQSVKDRFQVANGSVVRIQQLLSLLEYSPLEWVPAGVPIAPSDTKAQIAALYKPPGGNFKWREHGWPAGLLAMWQPGVDNVFTRGLIMSFDADHALTADGAVEPGLWGALLGALSSNTLNSGGYNYALADKTTPESLTIYHDGAVVATSPANTGIGVSPTPDGTFPVFERLRQQVMRGTNPGGGRYADLVQYIAYFHGNDAVHYMDRADYGIPQSLGCIELPLADAARVWPYLAYGTLVTIIN
jgi:hypothetical protein